MYELNHPNPREKVKNPGVIPDRDEIPYGFVHNMPFGKHAFILKNEITDKLSKNYKTPVVMKIYDTCGEVSDLRNHKWGDDPKEGNPAKNTLLWDATQIQNIAAWHGLAPKVYELDTILFNGKKFPVQIVEECVSPLEGPWWEGNGYDNEEAEHVYEQVKMLGKTYGFSVVSKDDVNNRDIIGSKLVDFQTFCFKEPYEDFVRKSYIEDGRYGKVYYQDVPELNLTGGPRKSPDRVKMLALDKIDFKEKSVLDIGCAGGFFCRYALEHGARYVKGVDMKLPVESARNLANYLGKFAIDYEVADLSKGYDAEYDIVFFLSMNYHIAVPEAVKKAKHLIFEDNSKDNRHNTTLSSPWTEWFSSIEHVGTAVDHGNKSIYHLKK